MVEKEDCYGSNSGIKRCLTKWKTNSIELLWYQQCHLGVGEIQMLR